MNRTSNPQTYTPPLGHKALTPLYDRAIAVFTLEHIWRKKFLAAISPQPEDRILDVGSGTGTLALQIAGFSPQTIYLGIDPDTKAVVLATEKLKGTPSRIQFEQGFLTDSITIKGRLATKVVSSLVLHQVPLSEKKRLIALMFDRLQAGGQIHIADYGEQRSVLMKTLFRLTFQTLDGVEHTQPNAHGILPKLMKAAGFENVEEYQRIATPSGSISLYRAEKALSQLPSARQHEGRNTS